MPTHITLYKLTEQGIKDIKSAPERIEEGIKGFEAAGGKLVCFYATQGEYDYVAIGEHPDELVGSSFILAQGTQGNVRTTTLRVFTVAEFKKIVEKIP